MTENRLHTQTEVLPAEILDSLASGILAMDLDGCILFLNTSLAHRLRINRDAWTGKPALELFRMVQPSASLKRAPLFRLDPRRDGERTVCREVEWIEGSRTVHLREDGAPLRDASGRLIGRMFAYHDLSWEKTVDQMKSEFISIASHELRTPMTSIKGSIDLILSGFGEVGDQALELLEVAQSGCDRMIRLINDLLDLSKIEAGQIQLKLAPTDLEEIAKRSARSLEALAAQDGIAIGVVCSPELPQVMADKDRIEQVVTNLLSNAIKFSPAKGEIGIRLSAENGWVSCGVSDQGCGIPENDLDRIFGKFQQVGTPQRGGGTGLGLAITHALVTEHKGKIWVESRVGEGSHFIFCLPAIPNPKA